MNLDQFKAMRASAVASMFNVETAKFITQVQRENIYAPFSGPPGDETVGDAVERAMFEQGEDWILTGNIYDEPTRERLRAAARGGDIPSASSLNVTTNLLVVVREGIYLPPEKATRDHLNHFHVHFFREELDDLMTRYAAETSLEGLEPRL